MAGSDDLLIAALVGGATQAEAARVANVSERTVRRRLDGPGFCLRLDAAREQALDAALAELGASALDAVRVLRAMLEPLAAPLPIRLAAARTILSAALRLRDRRLVEIDERLSTLERERNDAAQAA